MRIAIPRQALRYLLSKTTTAGLRVAFSAACTSKPKTPQGKLVQVLTGSVFDVVVDCRPKSPSFGKWHGAILSAENHQQLWVPPGCAHGFYVLSDHTDFLYKCTDYYHPESELTLAWDDPDIGVVWPIPAGQEPQVSDKDRVGVSWYEMISALQAV